MNQEAERQNKHFSMSQPPLPLTQWNRAVQCLHPEAPSDFPRQLRVAKFSVHFCLTSCELSTCL